MFSNQERCLYRNNQLGDVICQIRFPEILTIGANLPVDFQEEIRHIFPKFTVTNEAPSGKQQIANYRFATADETWQLNLTSQFIALTCKQYTNWESFANRFDVPLSAFIRIYKPAYFERIGLRYMNMISRNNLELSGIPYRELIQPEYLGLMADDNAQESAFTCCSCDYDIAIRHGCRAKIHAGPGRVVRNGVDDGEVKFIFDLDLYMKGNIPVNYAAGSLETIHAQAFPIFRGAITQTLHDALDPI